MKTKVLLSSISVMMFLLFTSFIESDYSSNELALESQFISNSQSITDLELMNRSNAACEQWKLSISYVTWCKYVDPEGNETEGVGLKTECLDVPYQTDGCNMNSGCTNW
ncbi:hypothetical protein [Sediminibacterium sp. C3]|uniref:hypothetical protein n=1 Tax=Sediminibacterium sp. C3 TaxID=1267211 RepID=UPI00047E78A3|nr:hypothetical protein [Sediminibacterium sp. C3]